MAAIIEPHRLPPRPAPRPALRLVAAHDGGVSIPVEVGITPAQVAAAVAAVVVAVLLALAIGRGAFAALAPAPTAAAPASASAPASSASGVEVTVRPGDTLWAIARRVQPTGDVRPLVDRLVASYGTTTLQPGQVVSVPR